MSDRPIRIGLGMLPHPDGPHTTSGYASYTSRLLELFRSDPIVDVVPMLEPASRLGPSSPHRIVRAAHRFAAQHSSLRRGVRRAEVAHVPEIEYTAPGLSPYSAAGEARIEWFDQLVDRQALDACHFILTGVLGTAPFEACRRRGTPYVVTVVDYGAICGQGIMRERDERICSGPESPAKCTACLRAIGRVDARSLVIERRRRAYSHYYGHAERVFTFTQSHADLLSQWLEVDRSKFEVSPFAVPSPSPTFAKSESAFTPPIQFAFVARTCPEWGVSTLVDAWRRADVDPAQGILHLYTDDGFERSGLRAANHDLIDRGSIVVTTDRVADRLDEVHAETAVVVVPSEWRNTGSSSGLEALVRSTPVITNDEFGMYEDLPQGQRVLAYPTGSVEVLADRIRLLVRNPSILQELSTAPFHRTFGDHVAPIREVYLEARRAIG